MYIQRVVTVHEVDVEGLPPDLQVLSDDDLLAIGDSAGYFGGLAEGAGPAWLRGVLESCGESEWHLEFYATVDDPLVPYFRFYWGGGPAICLPRDSPLRPGLPAPLKDFYALIGGFQENEFGEAGGISRQEELRSIGEMGVWVSDEGRDEVDPAGAIAFLETFSGSQLCYLPDGRGAWLRAGQFEIVEDLGAEIARYFEALLAGRRI